jgi:hypothetical protein
MSETPIHQTSGRTEEMPDGTFGAWYTVDGTEFWCGTFGSQKLATIEVDRMLDAAEPR